MTGVYIFGGLIVVGLVALISICKLGRFGI